MKKIIGFCFIMMIVNGCAVTENETKKKEIAIIDEAFMSVIDTLPYRYHSLRPAPNDTVYKSLDTLYVAITPKLLSIRKWKHDILNVLSKRSGEDSEKYKKLLYKSDSDSAEIPLPVSYLTHTGRYKLFPYTKRTISIDTLSAIGKIEFSRVYYDSDNAILITTIRDHIKNGVVKLLILKKTSSQWVKTEEFILEIW